MLHVIMSIKALNLKFLNRIIRVCKDYSVVTYIGYGYDKFYKKE